MNWHYWQFLLTHLPTETRTKLPRSFTARDWALNLSHPGSAPPLGKTSLRRWLSGRGSQGVAAGDPPWWAAWAATCRRRARLGPGHAAGRPGADRDRCWPPRSSSPASANPNKPRCRQPCVWGFERVLFFREMLLCWNASNQLKSNNLPWVSLQWRENLNVRRERSLPPPLF